MINARDLPCNLLLAPLSAYIESANFVGDCDNMDYPYCSLVNASPVNNGSGTIYQTTVSGPSGQQTELFSSGMQYSGTVRSLPERLVRFGTFCRRRWSNDRLSHGPAIAAGHCLHDPSRSIFHLHADGHLLPLAGDDTHTEQSGLARQRRLVERRVHPVDSRSTVVLPLFVSECILLVRNNFNRFRFHSFAAVLRTGGLQSFHLPFATRVW